ncbi:MAG TPA: hypothetical protein PKA06_11535, partial [Gemmatales bacterium]|nr:hypothetical protein [Gemmatales bacterium]
YRMPLPEQTRHLLAAARLLHKSSRSEAILLLPEHDLDWDEVLEVLEGIKVIVAPLNKKLADTLTGRPGFHLLSLDYRPVLMRERLSLALLEALTAEMVRQGSSMPTTIPPRLNRNRQYSSPLLGLPTQ